MSVREYKRVLLADLPAELAEGYRPANELPCGAVGCDPWCAGTLAVVLLVRDVPEQEEPT